MHVSPCQSVHATPQDREPFLTFRIGLGEKFLHNVVIGTVGGNTRIFSQSLLYRNANISLIKQLLEIVECLCFCLKGREKFKQINKLHS